MRQFDVQHWGQSSDPLPTTAGGDASAESSYGDVPTSDVSPAAYSVPEQYGVPTATVSPYQYASVESDAPVPAETPEASDEVERMPLVTPMPDVAIQQETDETVETESADSEPVEEEQVRSFRLVDDSPVVLDGPSAPEIPDEEPSVETTTVSVEPEQEYEGSVETFELKPRVQNVTVEPIVEPVDLMEEAERLFDPAERPSTRIVSELDNLLTFDDAKVDETPSDQPHQDDSDAEGQPEE